MRRKRIMGVVVAMGAFLGFIALAGVGVGRTAVAPHPVISLCNQGWYVNPDEEALLPDQVPTGFLFDGPSLVHHAVTPVSLATAPLNGAFTADVSVGVAPLFKMETTSPYSTINKTAVGKFWSSKVASGLGSQAMPVDTLAALGALAPYTADSKVYSFGVGYANDAGNKAIVKTVTFGGATYDLKCAPVASSSSAAPSASASASAAPSASGSSSGAPVPALPLTGDKVWPIVGIAAGLIGLGGMVFVLTRRRKVQFRA